MWCDLDFLMIEDLLFDTPLLVLILVDSVALAKSVYGDTASVV